VVKKPGNGLTKLLRAAKDKAGSVPVIVEAVTDLSVRDRAEIEACGAMALLGETEHATLLDEATRALHVPFGTLCEATRETIAGLRLDDPVLQDRLIAIVDDDIRNVFSLTSIFEQHKMRVVSAENGLEGIALLGDHPDIDAMLIDIMMPELDGYETILEIRRQKQHADLPLIAVTAKAMPEDRAKCFEAGATDYLSKPVDIEELLAVLRTCLRSPVREAVESYTPGKAAMH
jgi:CheY-like chemotaxis protein